MGLKKVPNVNITFGQLLQIVAYRANDLLFTGGIHSIDDGVLTDIGPVFLKPNLRVGIIGIL